MLATLLLALLPAVQVAGQSLQVAPTRFEFSLAERFTDFFTVTNTGGAPTRVRVYAEYLETDGAGGFEAVQGAPHDLTPWLVINPRRITVAPGGRRVVRFSIRPPGDLAPGEYRTVIFFEALPPPPEPAETPAGSGSTGETPAVQLTLNTRVGITIYGRIGEPAPELALADAAVVATEQGVTVRAVVRNSGSARGGLTLRARLLAEGGAEAAVAERQLTVQREQTRVVRLELTGPTTAEGRLELVGLTDEQARLFERTLNLTASGERPD